MKTSTRKVWPYRVAFRNRYLHRHLQAMDAMKTYFYFVSSKNSEKMGKYETVIDIKEE